MFIISFRMSLYDGLITPPNGLSVFIINKMAKKSVPISDTFIELLPFLARDLVRVSILFCFRVFVCF